MKDVIALAKKVAASDANTILIQGRERNRQESSLEGYSLS